jgi:hypothetical protein
MSNKNKDIQSFVNKDVDTKEVVEDKNVTVTTNEINKNEAVEEVTDDAIEREPVKNEFVKKDAQIEAEPITKVEDELTEFKNNKTSVSDGFKINDSVKLKEGVNTATGTSLPAFAFRNTYKITKILESSSRLILKAGNYTIAVTKDSVVRV